MPYAGELARAARIGPALENWFLTHGRVFAWRRWRNPYRLAVIEVLLQRTRAEAVASFVPAFLLQFPSWTALAEADALDLEEQLRPLGLHRRRAASLLALARSVVDSPLDPWESRPGIGQYISRAMRVALAADPVAMVDANFVRVMRRAFRGPWMSDYRYDRRLQALGTAIVIAAADRRAANWAILDLAAAVCRPRAPRCGGCPLADECITGAERLRGAS